MKISVFTPTFRPGLDVAHSSILRQKVDAEIQWIVCDQLFEQRSPIFFTFAEKDRLWSRYEYKYFYIPIREGHVRNLARAYNTAMDFARGWDADLFISMQDYIYVPEDGLARWKKMYEEVEVHQNTKGIYTGITSISADPHVSKVKDPDGMYTIFDKPYQDRPQDIDWLDVRYKHDLAQGGGYYGLPAIEFETNWACYPKSALYDDRLYYDEEYDKAVAYENQDFAYRANSLGYELLADFNNKAISLPHKRYFADEWAREQPLTDINRQLTESRWQ